MLSREIRRNPDFAELSKKHNCGVQRNAPSGMTGRKVYLVFECSKTRRNMGLGRHEWLTRSIKPNTLHV